MRRDHGIRESLRKAKIAGLPIERVWETIETTRRDVAQVQGWRPSEIVATLTLDLQAIESVYGKRARRRIEQLRAQRAVGKATTLINGR